jgi:Subtilase family
MVGSPRREFSPLLVAPLCAAALGLALLVPGVAAAAPTSALAPELAKLATPTVAAASAEAQAEAVGLPAEGPGSLSRDGERVILEAHFEAGALARLEALKAAGAKILVASARYQTVALSAEPEDLEAIGAVPGLSIVVPSLRPLVYGAEGEEGPPVTPNPACEGGSVISQGVEQLNVPVARQDFGTLGTGVTVGVLSDSFDSATESVRGGPIASDAEADELSDDLPGPGNTCSGQQAAVNVIAEAPEPASDEAALTDEGRAMLQVVHDVAPEAELAFATAFTGELGFARNIERLAEPVEDGGAGAKVIVDDVAYPSEPFFQEGPIANAIRRVTEAGITYLTAAGNNNLIEAGTNHEIASWERSRFHDTTCPGTLSAVEPRVREAKADCMNFSPTGTPDSTFGITVRGGATLTVDLQWAEPWYGVHADLNAYLLNASGQVLVAHPYKNVGSGSGVLDEPLEYLSWKNPSSAKAEVQLVIDRCIHNCNLAANVVAKPRLKVALLENGFGVSATQYPESDPEAGIVVGPTIFGHAGSPAAITLGAVYYAESALEPKEPEPYSSRGPVAHYFGPVSGTTAAAALEPGEAIAKPNLTATDCGATTFFDEVVDGEYLFCGTSEAAPHAAGVAALMKEADPLASPKGIREAMEESATPYTSVTSCEAVGAGLLNADGALAALENSGTTEPCGAALGPEPEGEEEEMGAEEGTTNGGGGGEEQKTTPAPTPPAPTPTPPVVTITKGPNSLGNESRPTFEFTSSKPASFGCQIDGGTPQPCSSPYVVPTALVDGSHGFVVTATDSEGVAATSAVYDFTVDTTAPLPRIVGHPSKLVKIKRSSYLAHFRLAANEPATFYCEFDREPLRACGKSFSRRFIAGSHVLKVRAKDAAGNLDTVSAIYRFRIKDLRPARPAR